ncbi:MAG: phosphoglycerate mutase family protein, partial [Alphaproteobacteria bacterium]|nr:phosphoglycerate mutase family protein [Alphaproteobacteria bacterium]
MELYLIRHGQSKWQVDESTSKDSKLTKLGHEQSQYLNQHVVNSTSLCSRKSVIYVSPQ